MPEQATITLARAARRRGKSPSTQAGEFVREEIRHVRRGEHGARSTKQIIAIGLSMARRAGIDLPPPRKGHTSHTTEETRRRAIRDYQTGHYGAVKRPSRTRARATLRALRREGGQAASKEALSKHARAVARQKSAFERSLAAKKAVHTRKKSSA